MRRTYKSKVEKPVLIPLAVVLVAIGIWLLREGVWLGAAAVGVVLAFLAYLYYSTAYELTANNTLRIRIGFFYNKEIYIRSIKKIRPTRNAFASPALSGDRIEIQFNRYERVLISPEEKTEFISRLQEANPRINVTWGPGGER